MKEQICELCGGEIIFRYLKGRCTPIHLSGHCYENVLDVAAEKPRETLLKTKCPECHQPVYFLRHNGGSVWLDDIPWPWPKHSCFQDHDEPLPENWLKPLLPDSPSELVRLLLHKGGRNKVSVYPVLPSRKNLGSFFCHSEDDPTLFHLDKCLALVQADLSRSTKHPVFLAVGSNGFHYKLTNTLL